MVAPNPASVSLAVSVIVPARNEEASLGACLESLVTQAETSFEVIVVDDDSTDRTREIAQSFSGVLVIDAGPLPANWSGKCNALVAGAKVAHGEWLLFTDADTVHRTGSLARALSEAHQHGSALLSYSPQQEVSGFWEKAIMPVIFAELASTYRPVQVNDPASRMAAASGQYLMIQRSAYDAVGGYAAVATSLLDDVALAHAVKASGRKIFFRFGADAVRTRMYRNFSQLREGWTKNLALLFPSPLQLAVLRLIEFVLIVGGVALAVSDGRRGSVLTAIAASVLAVVVYTLFLKRIRKAHFRWDANAVSLFGLPVFSYLLIRSQAANASGNVTWKGRTYGNGTIASDVTSPQSATPPVPTASKEPRLAASRRELGRET